MRSPEAWRSILPALVLTLAVSGAAAQPAADLYEAQLARPAAAAEVTVGGVDWHCEGVTCLAESSYDLGNVKACRILSDRVGRIVAFGPSGEPGLDDSTLETCNGGRAARGGAAASTDRGDGGAPPAAPAPEPSRPREAEPAPSRTAEAVAAPAVRRAGDLVRADPREVANPAAVEPFVYYKIRNRNSSKPMAVSGGHVQNGASVIQWADRNQRDIYWRAIPSRDGTYKLKNRASGRFLAVSGGGRDDGRNVIQWDDDDQGDVHWRFEPTSASYVKIRNAATGKILIVPEGMKDDGANIVQWQDLDRRHAEWRLQPAADIRRNAAPTRASRSASGATRGPISSFRTSRSRTSRFATATSCCCASRP